MDKVTGAHNDRDAWLVPFRGWDRASMEPRFFLKQDNLYLSDDCVSASWAWIQHARPEDRYQFVSISRWNMSWQHEDHDSLPYETLKNLTLPQYYNLRSRSHCRAVSTTNCFAVFLSAFYESIETVFFSTGDLDIAAQPRAKNVSRVSSTIIPGFLRDLVTEHAGQRKLIIYLDCDYFRFYPDSSGTARLAFSDDYISHILGSLKLALKTASAAVITISFRDSDAPGDKTGQALSDHLEKTFKVALPFGKEALFE